MLFLRQLNIRLRPLLGWGLRLGVLASYLFAYGGLAPLLTAAPVKAAAAPLNWQKLTAKTGMACGSKKGLICLCERHAKGTTCCCRATAPAQGLSWSPDPCGTGAKNVTSVGSHFQSPFPQHPLALSLRGRLPLDPAKPLLPHQNSDAPDKVPLG